MSQEQVVQPIRKRGYMNVYKRRVVVFLSNSIIFIFVVGHLAGTWQETFPLGSHLTTVAMVIREMA